MHTHSSWAEHRLVSSCLFRVYLRRLIPSAQGAGWGEWALLVVLGEMQPEATTLERVFVTNSDAGVVPWVWTGCVVYPGGRPHAGSPRQPHLFFLSE